MATFLTGLLFSLRSLPMKNSPPGIVTIGGSINAALSAASDPLLQHQTTDSSNRRLGITIPPPLNCSEGQHRKNAVQVEAACDESTTEAMDGDWRYIALKRWT
ncbi:MAG TPA: hypothetical protein VGD52_21395 [Pseudoduganella sp.]